MIPAGLCQCGCGGATKLARDNDATAGYVKGQPMRFMVGHRPYVVRAAKKGAESPVWKGGVPQFDNGYVRVYALGHPRAYHNRIYEHILVAESVLGRYLRKGENVHHIDENRANNTHSNLVICDQAYHKLLHKRINALKACGNASWLKCSFCKEYDAPDNLMPWGVTGGSAHRACGQEYQRKRYLRTRKSV